MLENILIGLAQGIGEWLPISSEGLIILIQVNFLGASNILNIIDYALFLHLGTALAAIVFFHKDIWDLVKNLFHFNSATEETKKTIWFLIFSTAISGLLGLLILQLIPENNITETGARTLTILIGVMLLVTAFIQIFKAKGTVAIEKGAQNLNVKDTIILSLSQAVAVVPGLSRSGLTVGAFLLLGYSRRESLRLSFLMSIPIVIVGNIVLNLDKFIYFNLNTFFGLASSFIFGLLTIGALMKLAEKINFGYFVFVFAILTFIAGIFM